MSETLIEWADEVWNPTRGCSPVSPGCKNCYAERVAGRFSGPKQPYHGFASGPSSNYHGGTGAPRSGVRSRWTGKLALIPEKLVEPLHWKKPRRVFVNSMSDLFHEALSDEDIEAVFGVMALAPHVTFQVLTKRAERMRQWFNDTRGSLESREIHVMRAAEHLGERLWGEPGAPFAFDSRGSDLANYGPSVKITKHQASKRRKWPGWPLPNVWLGVSVEDQRRADERIPALIDCPAAVRFLSVEPLLERVDLNLSCARSPRWSNTDGFARNDHGWPLGSACGLLDWVIVGGESGVGARVCDLDWIRRIVHDCRAASVPCFVKQLGARPIGEWGDDKSRPMHHVTDLTGGARRDYVEESRRKNGVWVLSHKKGGAPDEWPSDLRVREFPKVTT